MVDTLFGERCPIQQTIYVTSHLASSFSIGQQEGITYIPVPLLSNASKPVGAEMAAVPIGYLALYFPLSPL